MKKIIALIVLWVCVILGATIFSSADEYPVEVNGAYITQGIYAYYLNDVMSNLTAYDIDADDQDAITQQATELCVNYLALINFMYDNDISLTQSYKFEIANDTQDIWGMFSSFYTSIGTLKTDITKIMTFEYSKNQLIDYYYGETGLEPVDDDTIIERFTELYVGFYAIEAPLTKVSELGEVIDLTDSEKENIETVFTQYETQINAENLTMNEANIQYNELQGLVTTSELASILIKDEDPMYDEEFFSLVCEIDENSASVIKTNSAYYLVYKLDITDDTTYYSYQQEVLYELMINDIEEKIELMSEDFAASVSESIVNDIYDTVYQNRN